MIDPDAVDQALGEQPKDGGVRRLKHIRHFLAHPGQSVHVEEAAPVDLVGRRTPPGGAIDLAFQQPMQPFPPGFALGAVGRHRLVQRHPVLRLRQLLPGCLRRGAHGVPPGDVAGGREIGKQPGRLLEWSADGEQDRGIVARLHRKTMLVIIDAEAPIGFVIAQHQISVGQALAVGRPKEWRQHPSPERSVRRVPIDVEVVGVRAGAAPFQHVHPPGIVIVADAHVIGHDIQDKPHLLGPECPDHAAERLFPAQFRVDGGVVHDVIAVRGAGAGGQQRGCVEMADAQLGEIWHQRRRVIQRETLVKLQARRSGERLHTVVPFSDCRRAATAGSSSKAAEGPGCRRCQLGCC